MDREIALAQRAADGDESAFGRLVGPYRRELHAHCYRMLGSTNDAEDVVQESLLKAWRGLHGFHGRASVRTWLCRVATNTCLSFLRSRKRRVLPLDLTDRDDAEVLWLEPYPDGPASRYEQTESLELAFVAALQHLPPRQRAALILRDVLGFSAREAAETLDTTASAVNSALQHARATVESRVPSRSQHATLRELGDERTKQLVARYMRALQNADLDAMIELLTEDATISMPPYAEWYRGEDFLMFLRDKAFRESWRHRPTTANGQPAVGCFLLDEETGRYEGHDLSVLTFDGDRISAVTAFIEPALFTKFGLPESLPVEEPA